MTVDVNDRPTEMLERQLSANRKAARRQPDGRRSYAHQLPYRPHFVLEMLAMRAELRRRKHEFTD